MDIADSRRTVKKTKYDIIVVGGGIAGISAAVAAARAGAKTLLMEKGIILGGLATVGLISWFEPLCDGRGYKMMGGIAEELIQLSIKYGFDDLPDAWRKDAAGSAYLERYATHFSPFLFAMALDDYLIQNHVDIILDCLAVFPVMEQKRCCGIAAETKEGRIFYPTDFVVDATGDADIFERAGAATRVGDNYLSFIAHGIDKGTLSAYEETENMRNITKWLYAGSNMDGEGQPKARQKSFGRNADEITEFVLSGRKLLFDKLKSQDRNARDVTALPTMPQFRTIRQIVGKLDFTATDRKTYADSIGCCGDFRPQGRGKHYQIPFGSLYNPSYENMIAAGRIISSDPNGWEVSRVIPVCALTGQAAGTAAAQCVRGAFTPNTLSIGPLQKTLKENGVLFGL